VCDLGRAVWSGEEPGMFLKDLLMLSFALPSVLFLVG
jgi:hypothetical protein